MKPSYSKVLVQTAEPHTALLSPANFGHYGEGAGTSPVQESTLTHCEAVQELVEMARCCRGEEGRRGDYASRK